MTAKEQPTLIVVLSSVAAIAGFVASLATIAPAVQNLKWLGLAVGLAFAVAAAGYGWFARRRLMAIWAPAGLFGVVLACMSWYYISIASDSNTLLPPRADAVAKLKEAGFRNTPADFKRAIATGDTEAVSLFLATGYDWTKLEPNPRWMFEDIRNTGDVLQLLAGDSDHYRSLICTYLDHALAELDNGQGICLEDDLWAQVVEKTGPQTVYAICGQSFVSKIDQCIAANEGWISSGCTSAGGTCAYADRMFPEEVDRALKRIKDDLR